MRFPPGSTVDHFEVLEELGEGAYAETYKARDERSGELVVLKFPHPNLYADPAIFQRFQREVKIARTLDHPGVVRSLDGAENRTEPYLVLEYVDANDFRHELREMGGRVPVSVALDWGHQLAATLQYLHEHGVTHRDLKPENLLITPDGKIKVIDFGTALLAGAKRLTWRHLTDGVGTPDYMSPEQIQGERGDARSDVYAWGVVMYELLAGRPPYSGDNWMAVMSGHLTRTPESLSKLNPEVPAALDAIIRKALRRYSENRYQSAAELLHDLDHIDEIDPSTFDFSPEPPMGGIAAVESTKRIWQLIAAVAVGFILLCALTIGLTVVLR
jgi:eukaryotic-like serine/threonine-protein kinase